MKTISPAHAVLCVFAGFAGIVLASGSTAFADRQGASQPEPVPVTEPAAVAEADCIATPDSPDCTSTKAIR